jgi:hypothetical protein
VFERIPYIALVHRDDFIPYENKLSFAEKSYL